MAVSTAAKITFEKIRDLVRQVPKGKVTTYGAVAKKLGSLDSRVVGWAMRSHHDPTIPCHRVVKKDGFLAKNFSRGGWQGQKKRLLKEGITFKSPNQVDLSKHFWKF